MIRDIKTGSGLGSNPAELTVFNGSLFFAASGNVYGRELWQSNGSTNQTFRFSDINPGGFNSNPEDLTVFKKNLYFTAETYTEGRKLFKTDGTKTNTILVQEPTEEQTETRRGEA